MLHQGQIMQQTPLGGTEQLGYSKASCVIVWLDPEAELASH